MKDGTPPKPASLLQAKWALIGGAIRMPSLSAGDCAVLWQICERYNEQAGAAWPSLSGLAADTKRDRKTVQRSIVKLIGAELLAVVRHGNRTESNRYRPEFDRFKVGAPTPLEVGAPVSEGRGAGVPKVGAPTPLESSYEPGYETGVHSGSPAHAVAGSGGGAGPSLVAPSVPPSAGPRFLEFWAAYPKARGVFKAEQTIGALLAEGVALAELVRGARAYAAWVQAQPWPDKDKYTKGPTNWLAARGWLDDYTVTPRQERPTKAPRSPPAPTKAARGTQGAKVADKRAAPGVAATSYFAGIDRNRPPLHPLRSEYLRTQKANARHPERVRCTERIRREFPKFADAITSNGYRDTWPAMTDADMLAIARVIGEEFRMVRDRIKADNAARFAKYGASVRDMRRTRTG